MPNIHPSSLQAFQAAGLPVAEVAPDELEDSEPLSPLTTEAKLRLYERGGVVAPVVADEDFL